MQSIKQRWGTESFSCEIEHQITFMWDWTPNNLHGRRACSYEIEHPTICEIEHQISLCDILHKPLFIWDWKPNQVHARLNRTSSCKVEHQKSFHTSFDSTQNHFYVRLKIELTSYEIDYQTISCEIEHRIIVRLNTEPLGCWRRIWLCCSLFPT